METARKDLHHLGFRLAKACISTGTNGRMVSRDAVFFLRKMSELGFLHPDQAPTPEAACADPTDVPLASHDVRTKSVVFFMMRALITRTRTTS